MIQSRTGYTQTAHGTFTVYVQPNTPHCGQISADHLIQLNYRYEVTLKYHRDALNEQGFLQDNLYFAEYFGNFKFVHIGISCEKLADVIADQLLEALGDRACLCTSVTVGIGAVPDVMVYSHRGAIDS